MKEFTIPKPSEQIIPQVSNLFKASLFVSLLLASFYTAQITVKRWDNLLSCAWEFSFFLCLHTLNCCL